MYVPLIPTIEDNFDSSLYSFIGNISLYSFIGNICIFTFDFLRNGILDLILFPIYNEKSDFPRLWSTFEPIHPSFFLVTFTIY